MKMSQIDSKQSTVQGRDTPVPVGMGSERVGSPRPPSSDHYVPLVNDQALALDTPSGNIVDPFMRRSSIQRTPPRQRTFSIPGLSTGNPFSKGESPVAADLTHLNAKRKRTVFASPEVQSKDDEETQKAIIRLQKIIGMLGQEAKALQRTVFLSSNTKKEIRDISAKIQRLTEQLMGQQIQEVIKEGLEHTKCGTGTTEDCLNCLIKPLSREIGIQTEAAGMQEVHTQTGNQPKKTTADIEKFICDGEKCEDLSLLTSEEWDENSFQKTMIAHEDVSTIVENSDIALYLDSNTAPDSKIVQKVADSVIYIRKIGKSVNVEPGKIACIVTNNNVLIEGVEKEDKSEKCSFVIGIEEGKDAQKGLYELYNTTKKLAAKALQKNKKHLTLIFQRHYDETNCRKTIECALAKADLQVSLYFEPKSHRNKVQSTKQARNMPEAIVIEKGNKTYADLLKAVKSELQATNLTKEVGNARMTKKGDLLLTMDSKAKDGAKNIAKALKGINGDTAIKSVSRRGDNVTLHLKGLDALATKKDVEDAIITFVGKTDVQTPLRVTSLRQSYGETQAATVMTTKQVAQRLTQEGHIRIGLANCKIRERIDLQTCYRCWEVGHTAKNCDGPDRSSLCRNCGEKGHLIKECTIDSKCMICNVAGHRSLTMKCPVYRKEVSRASRQKTIQ